MTPLQAQKGEESTAPTRSQHDAKREWVVSTTPRLLYPRQVEGKHCTAGWVGLGYGLDRHRRFRPHWDSNPRPSGLTESLYPLCHPGGYYTTVYYIIIHYMALYDTVLHYTTLCYSTLHSTVLHYTTLCCTISEQHLPLTPEILLAYKSGCQFA
jgi:hypothetical protein